MSLAELPTLVLIPPLNCLIAACAGAVFHRKRAGRVFLGLGLSGLVLLSLPLVSGGLIVLLERGLTSSPDAQDPPGAIVILSGDLMQLEQGGLDGFSVGHLTLERERAGARLARATGLPLLVSGGQIRPGAPSLAALMTASLHDDFGLAVTWQENRSQDTWQNAAETAWILRKAGVDCVYVVTHAWHMRRALMAFHAAGLRAVAAPVDQERAPTLALRMLIPRVSSWQTSYYALHEWFGCAWYALRG